MTRTDSHRHTHTGRIYTDSHRHTYRHTHAHRNRHIDTVRKEKRIKSEPGVFSVEGRGHDPMPWGGRKFSVLRE